MIVYMDHELDDGFSIVLSPIELTTETDYYGIFKGEDSECTLNLHDFAIKLFQRKKSNAKGSNNETSNDERYSEISFKLLSQWPKTVSLTYVHSGIESCYLYDRIKYIEHTGNEAQSGSNH
jgi:hypothetical protein